jgi:hypothetical protein
MEVISILIQLKAIILCICRRLQFLKVPKVILERDLEMDNLVNLLKHSSLVI